MYTCKKCHTEKPLSEYYKTTDRKSGHKTICKECIKSDPLTEKKKQYMKEYSKKYSLKSKYNLTEEDYKELLIKQNHKCAICGTDQEEVLNKKLYVDHDHETGKVRELLCHNCNVSLGLLKESIQTLTRAIAYLDKHTTGRTQ
jgi:hypothetical protein